MRVRQEDLLSEANLDYIGGFKEKANVAGRGKKTSGQLFCLSQKVEKKGALECSPAKIEQYRSLMPQVASIHEPGRVKEETELYPWGYRHHRGLASKGGWPGRKQSELLGSGDATTHPATTNYS
jgi:hypothetical protein